MKKMNAVLPFVLIFACLSFPARAARAEVTPDARPLLSRLERAIAPLRSFESSFVQVRHLALTDEKVEASGRLRFMAPDRFRLDYRSPDADVLTVNGDSMQVYFQAMKQAQRYRVNEREATQNLFLLFSARQGELEQKFDVSLAPPSPEGQALLFKPIGDALDYPITEIRVTPDPRTSYPGTLIFREQGGDVVLFKLDHPRANRKLTLRDFVFVPPRGTEIITRPS